MQILSYTRMVNDAFNSLEDMTYQTNPGKRPGGSGTRSVAAAVGVQLGEGRRRRHKVVNEPAERTPLRTLTTTLHSLSKLTSGELLFTFPLPVSLVNLSWECKNILDTPLPMQAEPGYASPSFLSLGDPQRYQEGQLDRPISPQLFSVHGAIIEEEIAKLTDLRIRVEAELTKLRQGGHSDPNTPDQVAVARPSKTRRSSSVEQPVASNEVVMEVVPAASAKINPLRFQTTSTAEKPFFDDVMEALDAVEKRQPEQ